MTRRPIAAAGALALLALAGCASAPAGATLTYESAPPGATILEGGRPLGVAPVTRTYAGDGRSTQVRTPEVTAVWPSGAKATFWTFLHVGDDRVATIQRPAGAPGLDVDQAAAAKIADENARADARAKRSALQDQARNSGRCRAQQAGGAAAVDNCSAD
jgi:hypothetical protein